MGAAIGEPTRIWDHGRTKLRQLAFADRSGYLRNRAVVTIRPRPASPGIRKATV